MHGRPFFAIHITIYFIIGFINLTFVLNVSFKSLFWVPIHIALASCQSRQPGKERSYCSNKPGKQRQLQHHVSRAWVQRPGCCVYAALPSQHACLCQWQQTGEAYFPSNKCCRAFINFRYANQSTLHALAKSSQPVLPAGLHHRIFKHQHTTGKGHAEALQHLMLVCPCPCCSSWHQLQKPQRPDGHATHNARISSSICRCFAQRFASAILFQRVRPVHSTACLCGVLNCWQPEQHGHGQPSVGFKSTTKVPAGGMPKYHKSS